MEWSVVDAAGRPAVGLHVLVGEEPEARLVRTDRRGVAGLGPDERPAGVLDALGMREVAFRQEGTRLVVDAQDAFGWRVPGSPVDAGNDVEFLKDSDMFGPMLQAIERARSSVHLSQLLLFQDFCGAFDGAGRPLGNVLERLLAAAERGAQVRILLNENWLVPDTAREVQMRCEGVERVEVRSFPMSPNVLHAKVLVVDGEQAFLVGPPFEQRYWDTASHTYHEPRRNDPRPLHDLSLRIRGPSVARVDAFFADLWAQRGPGLDPCPPPAPCGPHLLQLASTLPRGMIDAPRWHERAVREAYLRAFANARDYVYLETQYFTSPSVTQGIAAALDAHPGLQVILVLNVSVDVPTYLTWQKRRLASLGHPDHPRLGVFTLFTPTPDPARPQPIYVHSKLALADDVWASLGTANLDSLSLESGQEWGFEVEANVDVNALLFDGVEGAPRTGLVASVRRRVWAEHLGDEGVWTARRPEGGWLALWRAVAEANLRALDEGRFPARGRVLPYAPDDLPEVPVEEPPARRLAAER